MENVKHPMFNWIPIKLVENENKIYFEWIYLSDLKIIDPFFDDTLAKCRSFAQNSTRFKVVSTVENLIQWSEELESVELKGLVFHVSRCGSTMLSQSLASSEENIMISEASILDQILRSEILSLAAKSQVLKSVIRLLAHKRFSQQKNTILKLDAWSIFKVDYLRKVFPEIPFALLYRNPAEVLRSHQKMSGMHMVPNIIPASVFGIKKNEMQELSLPQYRALVLEKYFKAFLDFYRKHNNVTLLNYNDGMKNVVEKFISFASLQYSDEETNIMLERLTKHSKNENVVFCGDSYEGDAVLANLANVNAVHEKLNAVYAGNPV
ncbi:sulfotransferase family protein [Flavobacterium foetidum]|uniref:sulfotransferase family protein n=1 Tax=Flavobacterium foetidum TaxID=2026681 RepID=UPI001074C12D|nr:sulfotransferase family protein [Flavobacterium foetidum]KAF2517347.1 sulfotransferase family protein [Flavobacterium foetidum]